MRRASPQRPSAPAVATTGLAIDGLMPATTWLRFRSRMARRLRAHIDLRTIPLGPCMRLRFDDESTLRHDLQELSLAEGGADHAFTPARLAAAARRLPTGRDWRATLTTAPPDPARPMRSSIADTLRQIHLQVGIDRVCAIADEGTGDLPAADLGESSAAHALRFDLTPAMRAAVRAGAPVTLVCTHPLYDWRHRPPAALVWALRQGLGDAGDPPPVERAAPSPARALSSPLRS